MQKLLREEFPEGIEKAFMNEAEEGCEVKGYLEVNRVRGRFSISSGRSLMMGMQQIRVNGADIAEFIAYYTPVVFWRTFSRSREPSGWDASLASHRTFNNTS